MRYTNNTENVPKCPVTGNVPKCPVLLPRVPGVLPSMKGGTPSDDRSDTWQDVFVSVAGSSNALLVRLSDFELFLIKFLVMFLPWRCEDALANLAIFNLIQWCSV